MTNKKSNDDTNNLQLFRNQFDNLIDNFFPNNFLDFGKNNLLKTSFKPKINISENENAYNIEAELPVVSKQDIEINYADEVLKIKAEKKDKKEDKKKNYHRFESFYGTFQRAIHILNHI
jgi:HSP20 family protein